MGLRRPRASSIADFSMKASRAAPSMVHYAGRAPEQAKASSRTCWHSHWHFNVVPLMVNWMVSQWYCTPGLAQQSHTMLSPEGFEENRIRKIPSGKMLLERVGLTQCQCNVFSPSVEEHKTI